MRKLLGLVAALVAAVAFYPAADRLGQWLGVIVFAVNHDHSAVFVLHMVLVAVAAFASVAVGVRAGGQAAPVPVAVALGVLGVAAVIAPVILSSGRAGVELFLHLVDLMMWVAGIAAGALIYSAERRS